MAKVYGSPYPAPEYDYRASNLAENMLEVDRAYCNQLATFLSGKGYHHKLTGKIIRLPYADGCAQYMIANGTSLIHLPLGDAWQVPDYTTRGLRASDLARLAQEV